MLVKDTQVSGTDAWSPALTPLICKMSVKYLVYRALLEGLQVGVNVAIS